MEGGEEGKEEEEEEEESQLPLAKRVKSSSPSLCGIPEEVVELGKPGGQLGPNDLVDVLTELLDVSAVWEDIGLVLKLTPGTLQAIEGPYKRPQDCLRDMLMEWLNTSPNPSWKDLIQALRHRILRKEPLARHLERKYCSQGGSDQGEPAPSDTPSSPMDCFVESLKAEYKRVSAAADNKEYPAPTSIYTKLAVIKKEKVSQAEAYKFTRATFYGGVDEIMQKKTPIFLEDVFEPERGQKAVNYVLAEGAPGVGKSTFALELCRRWDSIGLMKGKFRVVVLLRLREKWVQEAKSVADLFYHDNPDIQEAVAKLLSLNNGENALLVLDGFDELPVHLRRSSFLARVLRAQCLQKATILVTSRPSARADLLSLRPQPDKHIEILGFTSVLVDQYVESVYGEDATLLADFLTYINANPAVKSMMYIPLNSAVVLEIYREYRREGRPIPRTITQLYVELTLIRIRSYLKDQHNCPLDALPLCLEDLSQKVRNELLSLAELAFEAYRSKKVIFESLPANCTTLGLMTASQELYLGRRGAVNYNFFHFTFQEFLAAFHISQLPVSEQRKIFLLCLDGRENEKEPPEMSVVWRFVVGLTGFGDIGWGEYLPWLGRVIANTVPTVVEESMDGEDTEGGGEEEEEYEERVVTVFLAQCLYEAQGKVNCGKIFGVSRPRFDSRSNCSVLDCYVLGYCVAASKSSWTVDLSNISFGPEMVEMLVCGLKSRDEVCGIIEVLNLSSNPIGMKGVAHLKELPYKILQGIFRLDVEYCDLDSKGLDLLSSIVPIMTSLEELNISSNHVGNGGTLNLLNALSEVNQLAVLEMRLIVEFSPDEFTALSSVRSLTSLSIGDEGMEVEKMLETVLSSSLLEYLSLFTVSLSVSSIASLQKHNRSLTTIQFGWCDLGHGVMLSLAKALCSQTMATLRVFLLEYFTDSVPTDRDITLLAQMLTSNRTLKCLGVNSADIRPDTTISREAVRALVGALKTNKQLEQLKIRCPANHEYFSDSELKEMDPRITLWNN